MSHSFLELFFTKSVLEHQQRGGSRSAYESFIRRKKQQGELTEKETHFITARDSFYLASISESGWPYIQHRGGPKGFVKIINNKTIGFADFSGNHQYITAGNLETNSRVSMIFMNYAKRLRLKLAGIMTLASTKDIEGSSDDTSHLLSTIAAMAPKEYPAIIERIYLIRVIGYDWNCPKYITPRFSEEEFKQRAR